MLHMKNRLLILPFLAFLLGMTMLAKAEQTHSINSASGAESWEMHKHGVTFSLTQILPDQARAFYVNRGFTLEQIESYATSCVFMTVLRNDSAPGTVHFIQQNWTISTATKTQPPMKVTDWLKRLKNSGVKKSALIAFRWAQFPPEQEYEPGGDWNQGMLVTGLPAGTQFNLIPRWDIDGKPYAGELLNVRCAQ